ncbi:MAG: PAS domain S-box protein [Acidobacteria bacterium]|nr:PAS domain S-box protein [Acidobacteriota bacterium]
MRRRRLSSKFPIEHYLFGALPWLILGWLFILAGVFSLSLDVGAAEPAATKGVLFLAVEPPSQVMNLEIVRGLRSGLQTNSTPMLSVYSEYLDLPSPDNDSYKAQLPQLLKAKYSQKKIDVIIIPSLVTDPFLMRLRDQVWPNTPVIIAGLFPDSVKSLNLGAKVIGITGATDLKGTLAEALKLLPKTQHVAFVSGTQLSGQTMRGRLDRDLQPYADRIRLIDLMGQSVEELKVSLVSLPENTIVLFLGMLQDRTGQMYVSWDVASVLIPLSKAPVFSVYTTWIEHGIVGGMLLDPRKAGQEIGELALRILRGEQFEDGAIIKGNWNRLTLNWRQLQKWEISEDNVSPEAVILFKEPSVWDKYKHYIVGAISLILIQTALIGGLLIERHRRRRAEAARRESEERFSKAFHSSPQPMSITTREEGRYIDVNERWLEISGYTREEVIGRTSFELNIWESRDAREELIGPLKDGREVRNLETRFGGKGDGFHVLLSSAELIELGGRQCVLVASSDITERKQAEQELSRLAAHLLNVQDEERRRLARELHDVTGQNLFAINMNLSRLLRGHLEPFEVKEILDESWKLGRQSLQEIRTFSYLLHPPMLDRGGLADAIKWYVSGFIKRSGIDVEVLMIKDIGRLPSELEIALYRIVQESLTNIRHHSGGSISTIRLDKDRDQVILQIRDNGHGAPSKIATPEADENEFLGVGIPGMRQRLRQLGGHLEIETSDSGTVVTATVPITSGDPQ